MSSSIRALFSSLGIRLLIPLVLTVGVVLAVYAFLSLTSTREHFLDCFQTAARRSSDLIRRATHDGMLLNRLGDVQTTIERLAEGPDLAAIRVYDKEGVVVLSSQRTEIGQRVPLTSPPCSACHDRSEVERSEVVPEILEMSHLTRLGGPEAGRPGERGESVLRHVQVIKNEASCAASGCHATPAEERVLGVLDVEISTAPLEANLEINRRQIVGTTLSLIVVLGAVATVFVRRVVQRPIGQLYLGTQRIAGGDLTTRIEIPGGHELAVLAEAFNRMGEDLARARDQLSEWSQTLEQKVAEKSEELRQAERQVLHMEKMASLGQLAATVAHELNNPLSGVLTYARLVERELEAQSLDEPVRREIERYLGLAQQECARCGQIVRNLLVFARRGGGEMTPVEIEEILERSLMLIRHQLEMSGVRLRRESRGEPGRVIADGGQLEQALVALLVNAIEAMNEANTEDAELGIVTLGESDEVRFEIRDNGTGIAAADLPHVFEPFFSTKTGTSGAGLGLAVVYGIVQRHGGTIEVESEPGRGTLFRLRLPRRPPGDLEVA